MGIPTLISTSTVTNSSGAIISSGIDSTYDEYMFVMTDINPATDGAFFTFQVNASGQSGYNEVMTTTFFSSVHQEDDGAATLSYEAGHDQAQGTGYQRIMMEPGNGSDESGAGILHLFSPADTTYVTHFYGRFHTLHYQDVAKSSFVAGYINVTAAITAINFKMSSGNFDGVIQMYGIA